MKTRIFTLLIVFLCLKGLSSSAQEMRSETYCNPINIDYTYMVYNSGRDISYRSGADPAVVRFRGEYYMFVTRSMGYWHSTDLLNWDFISPEKGYFQGCNAPAAFNYKDSILYMMGDPSGIMSLLYTDNPKKGDWKPVPSIVGNIQDPALFFDDDGRAFVYWGSSNVYPIYVNELDTKRRFNFTGEKQTLISLDSLKHGWERFGENHVDIHKIGGFMEGAWMDKVNGKYYLQYGAPGTEFNVYGDGVYVGDNPLGPFSYQKHNPFSYKPGGWMTGAGHGSTVLGPGKNYWHFGTMALSVNMNWERRICMFPTFFDEDGIMWSNSRFGDYPHYSPDQPGQNGDFRGWMLLSYKKSVKSSGDAEEHVAANITDEKVKSYWLAKSNDNAQWLEIDLGKPSTVRAVQVNYLDHKMDLYGKVPGLKIRYSIEASLDGKNWVKVIDRSDSFKDTPNDYVELETPAAYRFVRYQHLYSPGPNLAISDIRVFGNSSGKLPTAVKNFKVNRFEDKRDARISWDKVPGAQGYNVLWGISPDKLYSSWMVYDENELLLKALNTDQEYYFSIEAFNETGVSSKLNPVLIK